MNERSFAADRLSRTAAERIDRVCDRFEAAWKAGETPRIEDYLEEAATSERAVLLRCLLGLDLEYRSRAGDVPFQAEYQARFPEFVDVVLSAFLTATVDARASTADQAATSSVSAGAVPGALPEQVEGVVLGNYVLLEEIGAGGMGRVFSAVHRPLERLVAIKVISPKMLSSPEAVKRFLQEVRAAGKLINHPNVVTTYDAGEHDGIYYLAMEYVAGSDLGAEVRENGVLPVERAVGYVIQAAQGLQYAHERQIVHRDIKPSNLLVDQSGRVRIVDLGLARLVEPKAAEEGARAGPAPERGEMLGTWDFMSPEQAHDARSAGPQADIYSLGCTLFYLLAGRPPYRGETVARKLLAHRHEPIPSLCLIRPDVPAAIDAVFQKMVAKQPEDRYASMSEVIAALGHVLEAQPLAAPLEPSPEPGDRAAARDTPGASGATSDQSLGMTRPRRLWRFWLGVGIAGLGIVAMAMLVTRAWHEGNRNIDAETHQPADSSPAQATPSQRVQKPAEPPNPPAPPESPFAHEDLYTFIEKTIHDRPSKEAQRQVYTQIATTIDRGDVGTLLIGRGLTRDGKAYEITVRTRAWFPRTLTDEEAVQKGLEGRSVSINIIGRPWTLPENRCVTLEESRLRIVTLPTGGRALSGQIRWSGDLPPVEHLALQLVTPKSQGDATGDDFQYFATNRLPTGYVEVQMPLNKDTDVQHGGRFFLRAFLATRPAGFYRISNELVWLGDTADEDGKPPQRKQP